MHCWIKQEWVKLTSCYCLSFLRVWFLDYLTLTRKKLHCPCIVMSSIPRIQLQYNVCMKSEEPFTHLGEKVQILPRQNWINPYTSIHNWPWCWGRVRLKGPKSLSMLSHCLVFFCRPRRIYPLYTSTCHTHLSFFWCDINSGLSDFLAWCGVAEFTMMLVSRTPPEIRFYFQEDTLLNAAFEMSMVVIWYRTESVLAIMRFWTHIKNIDIYRSRI